MAQSRLGSLDMPAIFRTLGKRIRALRLESGWKQEDMQARGFSLRHWQFIEEGRPITVRTLLRVAAALEVPLERIVAGIGGGTPKGT